MDEYFSKIKKKQTKKINKNQGRLQQEEEEVKKEETKCGMLRKNLARFLRY